jgi:hypothetical protein
MNNKIRMIFAATSVLALAGCATTSSLPIQVGHPNRTILSTYRMAVTNETLLKQPRTSTYQAEVKSVLPERFFTPPKSPGKNTDSLAIYYHPVLVNLKGQGALNGTDQYLGLLSDSGLDYPIENLVVGTQLVAFLVADPAPRSDGLSEAAPSWVGYVDDAGMLRSLNPHDSVDISFENVRVALGL